jgi:hypothetical protein
VIIVFTMLRLGLQRRATGTEGCDLPRSGPLFFGASSRLRCALSDARGGDEPQMNIIYRVGLSVLVGAGFAFAIATLTALLR